jgi:UDP-4-amino-4,6-dideoxy-N-acetyl-beta-L-altrosamine N-acetyltransferase
MKHLRPVTEADCETLHRWRTLPEVAAYMYSDHEISLEEHRRWFAGLLADPDRDYRIIQVDGEDVGLVYLFGMDRHHGRISWGFYLVSPSVRGKGVGSWVEFTVLDEVFGPRGLRKLCCEVLAFNEAVVGMHQRFGFTVEGTLRSHIHKGGEHHDVVVLGMLAEDWAAARPAIAARLRAKGVISG